MKQIYRILNVWNETGQPVINEFWLLKLQINDLTPISGTSKTETYPKYTGFSLYDAA